VSTSPQNETKSTVPKEQKRALGRGLSALISGSSRQGLPSLDTAGSQLLQIPLLNISLNPFQPRESFQPEQLQELTDSIKQHGVLQPIVVRPKGKNTFELVAGERRFRSATAAGLKVIPAVVKDVDNRASLAIALIENIQRQQLNPIESAKAYQRLLAEFGLNQSELALELGKSQPAIANSLRLLTLPEPIVTSLSSGEISEGHAKVLLSVEDNAKIDLWKLVVAESLSVRETERCARANRSPIPRGIRLGKTGAALDSDVDVAHVDDQLSLALGTKVKLKFAGKNKGHIEVQFYDLDQLEGLIGALSGTSNVTSTGK
jgi:ParB family transcriptional regulator, chromosome partitioning protein